MTPHPGPDTTPAPNSPAFNIVRAEAAHALVNRLCTLIERAPANGLDAGPAVLRTCLERLETAELDLDLIGSTSLDPDLKTMLASARQTLALAWTRVRASPRLQHPGSSRDTNLPPDDLLDACIRVIANTAEIEHHDRSAKFTRNVITKTAHCASVQALMLRINQHFQTLEDLNHPSIGPSLDDYQPLLKETEACIHSAVLAYNENTPIRRENMPLHLSPLTSLQAQNNPDLKHFLQTFQDSSEPVSIALLQVPTEEDSGIVIVLAFEHEGAIHCKSVVEPYPYGFLPEHIIAHSRILFDVAQRTAENPEIGPYSANIQDLAVMIAHSVHAGLSWVHPQDIGDLLDAAQEAGADPVQIIDLLRTIAQGNQLLAEAIDLDHGRYQITTLEQAEIMAKAAIDAGIDTSVAAYLVQQMGHSPEPMGLARGRVLPQDVLTIIKRAKRMGLPQTTAHDIASLLGDVSHPDSDQLVSEAGYDSLLEDQNTTPFTLL